MTRKSDKRKTHSTPSPGRKINWQLPVSGLTLRAGLISLLIFILVWWLYPRLQFQSGDGGWSSIFVALVSSALFIWPSVQIAESFKRFTTIITLVGLGAVILANTALHFSWIGPGMLMQLLSTHAVFPVASLLAALLLNKSFAARETDLMVPFRSVLRQPVVFISFLLLIILCACLVFYRLGYFDFWEDEGLVMKAAMGLRDQGWSYLATGYDRAWLHSGVVSLSIQMFGESEWSARLPSALSGVLFCGVSFYVFYKWFGQIWLGILVAVVCLLTQEFLILFRYARMYAPLIPVFLLALYFLYQFLTRPGTRTFFSALRWEGFRFDFRYGLVAFAMMGLSLHLHVLSAIGVLAMLVMVILLWWLTSEKRYKALFLAGAVILFVSFLLGLMDVGPFKKLHSAFNRLLRPDTPEYAYFGYLFTNGLPRNISLLLLIAGTGLLFNPTYPRAKRSALIFLYLIVWLDLIFMVYLMADPGRDYRYIVHVVPCMVAIQFIVLYTVSSRFIRRWGIPVVLALPFLFAITGSIGSFPQVYVKHPWSPRYSVVYPDIRSHYQPGEALLYQNMKTYYLDPDDLAGPNAIKLGRRKEMSVAQFKKILEPYRAAWIIFDTHKAYHLHPDIIQFLMKRSRHVHGTGIDDHGVEVFYFVRQ